jgi:hypothetical protein
MADEIDRAQEHMEAEEAFRQKHTVRKLVMYEHTGVCLNCGEPLSSPLRWCDQHCQEDFIKRQPK